MNITKRIKEYLNEAKPKQKALFHGKEDPTASIGDLVTLKNGVKGTIDRISKDGKSYTIKTGGKSYANVNRDGFTIRKKAYEK